LKLGQTTPKARWKKCLIEALLVLAKWLTFNRLKESLRKTGAFLVDQSEHIYN
jgi:hypothetical protein